MAGKSWYKIVPYTVNQLSFARTLLNFHDLITRNKLVCGDWF